MQCENNNFNISEYYNEFVHLYMGYREKLEKIELYQALDETNSIWCNQKCELRMMIISLKKRKEKYDFNDIYEEYMHIYRERKASNAIMEMLHINMIIIEECISNVETYNLPLELIRTAKKDVLLKHLAETERLLEIINYDVISAEYAIKISRGYYFAGFMDKVKEYRYVFEKSKIPENFLLEWDKKNYKTLKKFLGVI